MLRIMHIQCFKILHLNDLRVLNIVHVSKRWKVLKTNHILKDNMENTFLMWPGGKNWFVRHQEYRLPKEYNRYIDPFLGGGSVYFYMEPKEAILSDVNNELITTYKAIKTDWKKLNKILKIHARKHSDSYYYNVREQKPREMCRIAARMIYLNRTCFNGIYRVNNSGVFNVPRGSKNTVFTGQEYFEERSELLQNAELNCCDFETTIDRAEEGDFLFCDPPYAIKEEESFVRYSKNLFDWADQIRLANALERAKKRGVKIIMTNVNHKSVRELYENKEGFALEEVSRYSSISGKKEGRKQYSELIVSANI